MNIIFSEKDNFTSSSEDEDSREKIKKNNIFKMKDSVVNYVKKTKQKLTHVNVKNVKIRKRVDLTDNMKIRKESRTKRIFYLGDEAISCSLEEFAPKIFQNIRRIFNISNSKILEIFKEGCLDQLEVNISTGKTGSFFLNNSKYKEVIMKSIRPGEHRNMLAFVNDYYKYFLENENTLICPILGIYTLNLTGDSDQIEPIYLILMKNIIPCDLPSQSLKKMIFDIKGSTDGRRSIKDKSLLPQIYSLPDSVLTKPLKDLDFNEGIGSLSLSETHPEQ